MRTASRGLRRGLLCVALSAVLAARPAAATTIEDYAKTMVGQMASGDFAGASARFDAKMKEALPPDKLAAVWKQIGTQAGGFKGVESTRLESKGAYRIVYVGCKFESMPIDAKVVFDSSDSVAGLFFAPNAPPQADWTPPDYVRRESFDEKPVTVDGAHYHLPGFLTLPKGPGPFPAVVLVHGSGPHDQDEAIGPNKPFRDLAWGLSSQGIAVVRYVKRTLAMSQDPSPSIAGLTVEGETLEDARTALALLAHTAGIDSTRLFVIGHSLGGYLAPRLAASDPRVAGIVVMAGNTRPVEDIALEQVRWLANRDGKVDEAEKSRISALERTVKAIQSPALSDTATIDFLGAPTPGSYWLDLRDYHPERIAARLRIPILGLRGERDYQVSMADFSFWQMALANKPNATFKLYPGLNHLFITGTGEPGPEEYSKPGHVSGEVVQDIAGWIANPVPKK